MTANRRPRRYGSPVTSRIAFCSTMALVTLILVLASGALASEQQFQDALKMARRGNVVDATAELEQLRSSAHGDLAYRCDLALGNLNLQRRRTDLAIPILEDVQGGSSVLAPYATLLLVRAYVLAGAEPERVVELSRQLSRTAAEPGLVEEAEYLNVKGHEALADEQACIASARRYLERHPDTEKSAEVRWILVQQLERVGQKAEAFKLAETIWIDTPASPYALQANKLVKEYTATGRYSRRRLTVDQQFAFARRLQRAGRHGSAADELESYLGRGSAGKKIEARARLAESLYRKRRNDDAVAAATQLRRQAPGNAWTAKAGIHAIKSLRRRDRTPEVRDWCLWVADRHRGEEVAEDALYNLATYTMNMGLAAKSRSSRSALLAESTKVFKRLIGEGRHKSVVTDGYWKYAWLLMRTDRRAQALPVLEELLQRYPKTGYRSAAMFWMGKLESEMGRQQSATRHWRKLYEESPNTYYGHRAKELLDLVVGSTGAPKNLKRFPTVDRLERPRGDATYDLIIALKDVGLYGHARTLLGRYMEDHPQQQLDFALASLQVWSGDPTAASRTLRRKYSGFVKRGGIGIPDEFWQILYPLNYWNTIEEEAAKRNLDPGLVVAIIKNESFFDPDATSFVGAVGLMQIMPDTAPVIASALRVGVPSQAQLYDPILNIRFGTWYFSHRVENFEGNSIAAICSYNAGVNPVKGWMKRYYEVDLDEWIDTIPYVSTRLYVKNIMRDLREYRRIYGI